MEFTITVAEKKAKNFLAFLKELDFIEVEKNKRAKKVKKEPDFSYFGACPDWDIEANELRKNAWSRKSVQW